jgi:hypothetical protein
MSSGIYWAYFKVLTLGLKYVNGKFYWGAERSHTRFRLSLLPEDQLIANYYIGNK